MRKAINASLLVLALACLTYAGDILTPPAAQSTTTTVEEQASGEIPNPPEAVLLLINSVLSLL